MQKNINNTAQKQRRRGAWKSVIFATIWILLTAFMLLYLRYLYVPDGIWNVIMLLAALLELGMLIPIWILLKTRLKEIEGGEEDAAAQY